MGSILVVWNHSGHNLAVLEKAAGLLKMVDEQAVVVTFVNDLPNEALQSSAQMSELESEVYRNLGRSFVSECLFVRGDKAQWIENYCEQNDVDLVLKPWDRNEGAFFTHTDWQLIRHLKTDLLLAKTNKWHGYKKILAATRLKPGVSKYEALNRQVLLKANYWDSGPSNELHVVACIPMNRAVLDFDITEQIEVEQKHYDEYLHEFQKYLDESSIRIDKLHIKAGIAERVISQVAVDESIDLTVIGSRGKHGLGAVLLGNTAERILKNLRSDILIVRKTP